MENFTFQEYLTIICIIPKYIENTPNKEDFF